MSGICFSCGRPPRFVSLNRRAFLCAQHFRALSTRDQSQYVTVPQATR